MTRGQFRAYADETGYKTEAEKDGKGGFGWDDKKKEFRQGPKFTWLNPGFEQTDEHPVVNVSWNDAVAFCEWLKSKEGQAYRLPTEAEWEYACRAGTTTRYFNGDDPELLAKVGNVADATAKAKYPSWSAIAASDGYVYTAPVARFQANAFSLYDTHGNVWEWCQDEYDSSYYKSSPMDDPLCSAGDSRRVIRGGGWIVVNPRRCRSAYRSRYVPGFPSVDMGFRVARGQSDEIATSGSEPPSPAAANRPALDARASPSPRGEPEFITTATGRIKLKLIPAGEFMMGSEEGQGESYEPSAQGPDHSAVLPWDPRADSRSIQGSGGPQSQPFFVDWGREG